MVTTEFTVSEIGSRGDDRYVYLTIKTNDGQRFLSTLSAREHESILAALIQAGIDCPTSCLQDAQIQSAFRHALGSLQNRYGPAQGGRH